MRKLIAGTVIAVTAAGAGAAGYALHGQGGTAQARTVSYTARAHQLPSWVHWRQAPGFMRDVKDCGGGPAVIVWGGKGDSSALVCRSGVTEAS